MPNQLASEPVPPSSVAPPVAPPAPPKPTNGLALGALICGILAFLGAFIPFVNYVSGLLALVALVLGIVAALRKNLPKRLAISAIILSAVALILSVTLALVYTAGFAAAVDDAISSEPIAGTESDAAPDDAPVAEEEDAEVVKEAAVGTRENPAPIGSTVTLTQAGANVYEITPGAPTLNANDFVASANQFNEAPPAGSQWAMLPITIKYVGTETGNPMVDISVSFVSAAGTTHEEFDSTAVTPGTLFEVNELFPDAVGNANIVIAVPSADIEAGTWTVASMFFGEDYFFAAQ